ncbi:MAG: iron chelate uptake ABC transporter family permease subunit [Huintestinicola sp.]
MEKTAFRDTAAFKAMVLVILVSAVIAAFILGNVIGTMDISVSDIIDTIAGNHTGTNNKVIWNIRLPRMILAALVGINLALAGSILQGVMKNPLADPSIIGISSGAGLFGIMISF